MKFKIDITDSEKESIYKCFDDIFKRNFWTEGRYVSEFEEKFRSYVGAEAEAVAASSWTGSSMAVFEYIGVKDETVLVPSNTFMALPLTAIKAGANVEFVDCNRHDLCMSAEDLEVKIRKYKPKAVVVVHIGGHIAFDIFDIVELCRKNNVILIEDCAHAHGAEYRGKKAGTFGIAGAYSFYATKTITTGEGGMLVSNDKKLIEYAQKYRNYGKFEYEVPGLNYRMNEFSAVLGMWQTEKLRRIVEWKNEKAKRLDELYKNRVKMPDGMISGYYKYIVFDQIENSTGKVYDLPCHKIMKRDCKLPNTDWVAENHWCVPLFYKGDE